MIQRLQNIKPLKGDDEPFITAYYRDVPNGFRISNINDEFLEPYLMELEAFYSDYEIVGETYPKFFSNLNVVWDRKQEIVKKYANFDKTKMHYTYDTENVRTVTVDESGDSESSDSSSNTHIDTPISNDNDTPSNIDNGSSNGNNQYSKSVFQSERLILDDGDIEKVNKLTDNYLSVLDVLIKVFNECFVRFESYTY